MLKKYNDVFQDMDGPTLRLVFDKGWPDWTEHETNAEYERYGKAFLPGAFYLDSTKTIYTSEAAWRRAFQQHESGTGKPWTDEGLLEHECLHAWTGYTHSTAFKAGFLQSWFAYWFDTRSYTRFLRWRWNMANHAKFNDWMNARCSDWKGDQLVPGPAPKLEDA